MIYLYISELLELSPFFNVLKYLTFRSGMALITSLAICFFFGEMFVSYIRKIQNGGQPIRDDGPESHFSKKGTPTMGGVLIIGSTTLTTLLWTDIKNPYIWISLFVMLSFAALGFADDYLKISKKNTKGVSGKVKLFWQLIVSFIAAYAISTCSKHGMQTHLAVPFFKNVLLNLGLFYFVFAAIVITGASNAVNLTDGLDGLAAGPIMMVAFCFGLISYVVGNTLFAEYLQLHYIEHTGELAVFCAAIIGATLGFLWYNAPPAQIFMGDVGSLALGGALGVVSVITKHEIVLAIAGGIFVIEALSVIIQVASFKTRKVRVFKMAPLHHHYEKKGWSETKVVIRFWIISLIFVIIGLSTLKLR